MENINWLELFGYLASLVTAISLTMSSIVKLRWINLAGSILFSIYGLLIDAMPVAALNLFIAGINVYYLQKIFREKQHFHILEVSAIDSYLEEFIGLHSADILKFFPNFKLKKENGLALMIYHDSSIAGILIGHKENAETLCIEVDYVFPQYRDLKPGSFLFGENKPFFQNKGFKVIRNYSENAEHQKYLTRVGFKNKAGIFELEVNN